MDAVYKIFVFNFEKKIDFKDLFVYNLKVYN